jgi:hypothetical protein
MRGSCQCGQVSYETTEPALISLICHCKDCQKLSASAYSTTLTYRAEALVVTGELKRWVRIAESGTLNAAYFCPECGNRIFHENPNDPALRRLKPGTLDSDPIPTPQIHVWVSRKQPWVEIPPDMPTFGKNASNLLAVLGRDVQD